MVGLLLRFETIASQLGSSFGRENPHAGRSWAQWRQAGTTSNCVMLGSRQLANLRFVPSLLYAYCRAGPSHPSGQRRKSAMDQPPPSLSSPAQLLAMLEKSSSGAGEPPLEASPPASSLAPQALCCLRCAELLSRIAPLCAVYYAPAPQELLQSVQRAQGGGAPPPPADQYEAFPEPG